MARRGGCAVHDGDAVFGTCNLKSSQERLLGPVKLHALGARDRKEKEWWGRGERREGTITKAPLPRGRKAPPFIFSRNNAANSREIHPAISDEVKRSQEATMAEGVVDALVRQWGHYTTRGTAISRKVAPTIYVPRWGWALNAFRIDCTDLLSSFRRRLTCILQIYV